MKKRKYRVYFEQVNYDCFTVEAGTTESAVNQARKFWKECHSEPSVSAVEVDSPDGPKTVPFESCPPSAWTA